LKATLQKLGCFFILIPMKTIILACLFLFTIIPSYGQSEFNPQYQLLSSESIIQDKNFYLYTLMQQLPDVRTMIENDTVLKELFRVKKEQLLKSADYDNSISDNATVLLWTEDDIQKVAEYLSKQYATSETLQELVQHHMRPSGMFQLFANKKDADFLAESWKQSANGINNIIHTYAMRKKGRYPLIDSVSYQVSSPYYRRLINATMNVLADNPNKMSQFFQPSLSFALHLLDMNNRNEAARHEPMEMEDNQAAYSFIPTIQWEKYPYSVMLVPGAGPENPGVSLSPHSKLRNELAARRYHEGLVPLIVVSGGYVHPHQTPYSEAIEMKKDLMKRYSIPEHAILVDPHARHTTTNFRNASRLIFRYGIPSNKPALATTTMHQSYYITEMSLDERCKRELGYVPYEIVKRLNKHDVVWLPKINALHADPSDPLDP